MLQKIGFLNQIEKEKFQDNSQVFQARNVNLATLAHCACRLAKSPINSLHIFCDIQTKYTPKIIEETSINICKMTQKTILIKEIHQKYPTSLEVEFLNYVVLLDKTRVRHMYPTKHFRFMFSFYNLLCVVVMCHVISLWARVVRAHAT